METYTFGYTPNLATGIIAHTHPVWEVVCYSEGRGILTIGDRDIPFEPGLIVCQPPNVHHYERSETGFRNYYFHSPDFIPPNKSDISIYHDNDDKDFQNLLKIAYKMYLLDTSHSRAVLSRLISVFYEYFVMWESRNIAVNRNAGAVKNLIAGSYTDSGFKLTQELVKLGYCTDYIRRCFKNSFGITPSEYLTRLRIDHAKRLLENASHGSGMTVRAAAVASGFSDQFHFSKVYKKLVGKAPSQTLSDVKIILCIPEDKTVCLQNQIR